MPKSQFIRLIDVAFIGPLMVVGALEMRKRRPWLAAGLAGTGVGTMLFNAVNYWRLSR